MRVVHLVVMNRVKVRGSGMHCINESVRWYDRGKCVYGEKMHAYEALCQIGMFRV